MIKLLPNNTILYFNTNTSNYNNFKKINNISDSLAKKISFYFDFEIGRFLIDNTNSNITKEIIILKEKENFKFKILDSINYSKRNIFIIENNLIKEFLEKINSNINGEIYLYRDKEYIFLTLDLLTLQNYIDKSINKDFWLKEISFNKFYSSINKNQNIIHGKK